MQRESVGNAVVRLGDFQSRATGSERRPRVRAAVSWPVSQRYFRIWPVSEVMNHACRTSRFPSQRPFLGERFPHVFRIDGSKALFSEADAFQKFSQFAFLRCAQNLDPRLVATAIQFTNALQQQVLRPFTLGQRFIGIAALKNGCTGFTYENTQGENGSCVAWQNALYGNDSAFQKFSQIAFLGKHWPKTAQMTSV